MKFLVATCWLAIAGVAQIAVAQGDLRTVALSGQQVPDLPAGTLFSGFGSPVINSAGSVAISANSSGGNGIWSEGVSESLALVALIGEQAAGETEGNVYGFIGSPLISDTGQTAFFASVGGPSIPFLNLRNGVWQSTPSSGVTRVISSGMQAPGLPAGVTFQESVFPEPPAGYIDTLVMNRQGDAVLFAKVESSSMTVVDDQGFWNAGADGNLSLSILRGELAPGIGTFSNLSVLSEGGPVISDDGSVGFLATMSGSGVNSSNNLGIWSKDSTGEISLIARTGNDAPGLAEGVVYDRLFRPQTSPDGRLVFESEIAGPGVEDQNNVAIWSENGTGPQLVVRTGAPLPGDSGSTFGRVDDPIINSQGKAVFTGGISPFNSMDIWSKTLDGDVQPVALEEEQAPGLANFVRFREFDTPVINAAGQVAFAAEAGASQFGTDWRTGIWAETTGGQLTLIAAEGETLDVNDEPLIEDLRTIQFLEFADSSFGQRTAFNDAGQLAFSATFTDGTRGVFVSNLVAAANLPGDYNADGMVDAADYTVWRDGASPDSSQVGYDLWAGNYGANTQNTTANIVPQSVPEPAAAVSLLLACLGAMARRRVG